MIPSESSLLPPSAPSAVAAFTTEVSSTPPPPPSPPPSPSPQPASADHAAALHDQVSHQGSI